MPYDVIQAKFAVTFDILISTGVLFGEYLLVYIISVGLKNYI